MANKNQTPAYPAKMRKRCKNLVDKVGKTVAEICDSYGISKKTYYKSRAYDCGSVLYRGKKEHPETKIKGDIKILICEEKEKTNYGPLKMKLLIKRRFNIEISTTSIYKFYKKKGLIRRPQKKLAWYTPLKEPLIARFPGDVMQMDAKYIWEDNMRKYQRTFVDIWTGMQFAYVTSTMTAEDTINAFLNAEKYFPFKIFGIQNDNGSENRGDFHKFLGERGIAHYFIPKSSPQWDGSVERAHGVIDQEYYLNPRRAWKTLSEYLMWYNYERIHLGKYLNGMIPIEKWQDYQLKVSPLKVN
ncbi:DDE-type integrase/transposase/recombinase [Candidatus Nomurabacteria bacterium]|nr:DDE-type integrase/transposase/recombinase [Candidatus Nomurabacteria bacterium]